VLALATLVALSAACGSVDPGEEVRAAPAPRPPIPLAGVPQGPVLDLLPERLDPRNVTGTGERNEGSPQFSPDGRYLSFERRAGSAQALFVAQLEAPESAPWRVSSRTESGPEDLEAALLGGGGTASDDSFNTQLSFLPGGSAFVFTGNAGSGVYHLYQGEVGKDAWPITEESREDGHPAVSPDGRWLAYVSARAGVGKLFLRDLASGEERQLTSGSSVDLYPAWSPDSRSIAYTSGSNDNHDVFLIVDVLDREASPVPLVSWNFDDLRPTFSPDGRSVAFYSNFSPAAEDKEWSILVVPADGSGPTKGEALATHVAAVNVVTDPIVGPAWLPRGHALAYARNLKEEWNPIYVVDLDARVERRIETRTRMNHDLTCSPRGLLAFRAQVASWDDIFVAQLVEMP